MEKAKQSTFMKMIVKTVVIFLCGLLVQNLAAADLNRWDLTSLFANSSAWQQGIEQAVQQISQFHRCSGHMQDSTAKLKDCIAQWTKLNILLTRLNCWSDLNLVTDRGSSQNTENQDRMNDFTAQFEEQQAFFIPEIKNFGTKQLKKLIADKDLADDRQFFREILDHSEHILDSQTDALISKLSPILGGQIEMQKSLLTVDIPWPEVTLKGAKRQIMNEIGFERWRSNPLRENRKRVFEAFYKTLGHFERSMGLNLSLAVKNDVIFARLYKYPSALVQTLDAEKIPEDVYNNLIHQVNTALPVLHDYLRLIRRLTGVKQLEYFDTFAPVNKQQKTISVEQTQSLLKEALAPLGADYLQKITTAWSQRWMDVYPRPGKDADEFTVGSIYDVHPFVFLNFQNNFESVSTFAHEWGHAMHSVYTNSSQPYLYSEPSLYLGEIASQVNEILLTEYCIAHAKNATEKAFYLKDFLQKVRSAVFVQTMFAEFELALHEQVEHERPLSGGKISEMFLETLRRYFGHDQGVVHIDSLYGSGWEYVGHFYKTFYVYKYATTFTAAYQLASALLSHQPSAQDKYLNLLKAGSSKYPDEILLEAGVDLKKPDAYQKLFTRARTVLTELAQISTR